MRRPAHYVGLDMRDRICVTHERGCGDTARSQGTQGFDGEKQDKQMGRVAQIVMGGSRSLPVYCFGLGSFYT